MIKKLYNNFEEIVGSVLLVAICLVAAVQVASRYVLERPFSWTEEVGTYLFVYLVFIGASLALKKNEHFALEILADHLPAVLKTAVRLLVSLLVVVFAAIVVGYGTRLAIEGWVVKTPTLEIPRTIPYAAVPLGGALMLLRSGEDLARQILTLVRRPGARSDDEKGVRA